MMSEAPTRSASPGHSGRPCSQTHRFSPGTLTSQAPSMKRVINQHQFVEVELVGGPFPLGLVQNALL